METKISRYGAYGILCENGRIFLTRKLSGPYMGKWGLPGGKIEFGETPEEALKREFLEEAAMAIDELELFRIGTARSNYDKNDQMHHFHHVGILYKIGSYSLQHHMSPEEEGKWMELEALDANELTPFALEALSLCSQSPLKGLAEICRAPYK